MEPTLTTQHSLIRPTKLELRRAVLGVLLRAGAPLRVAEVVRRLADDDAVDVDWIDEMWGDVRKRVADVLRYQMMLGRVRRVRWGVYAAEPAMLSSSMQFRCVNWRRIRLSEVRGR